jgi:hypothetical protein
MAGSIAHSVLLLAVHERSGLETLAGLLAQFEKSSI